MRETGNQIIKLFLAFLLKDCPTQAMPCLVDRATVTQGLEAHCFMYPFSLAAQQCYYPHFMGRRTIIRKPAMMVVMILLDFACLKARSLVQSKLARYAAGERNVQRAFHHTLNV